MSNRISHLRSRVQRLTGELGVADRQLDRAVSHGTREEAAAAKMLVNSIADQINALESEIAALVREEDINRRLQKIERDLQDGEEALKRAFGKKD